MMAFKFGVCAGDAPSGIDISPHPMSSASKTMIFGVAATAASIAVNTGARFIF
jgi:hypothetical protein